MFPEETGYFRLADPEIRGAFLRYHADLLEPAFWQAVQVQVTSGAPGEFYPYPESLRFCQSAPGAAVGAQQCRVHPWLDPQRFPQLAPISLEMLRD